MVLDPYALFFKFIFALTTIFIILFSLISPDLTTSKLGEYITITLGVCLGAFFMAAATNMLMMYLSLELVSLSSYILTGYRKRDTISNEAALKYIVYGGVSSGIMVYGMSLLYGLTGSLNIYTIGQRLAMSPPYNLTLFLALLFTLAGFGYKIASVPFHFWTPDVYQGAPTPVTAFLSVASKAAGFAMMARFFYSGMVSGPVAGTWETMKGTDYLSLLAIISAVTMSFGNIVAIWQDNVKRLMAYSSIAHAGYVLMGVVLLSGSGLKAMMFYIGVYLFMNLGAFIIIIALSKELGSEEIADYRGLGWRSPFLAVAMSVFLFSLTGIPPMAGFVGKVYLFAAAIDRELYWLAVVGVLNSVVSLYYYAKIVKTMFLDQAPAGASAFTPSPAYTLLVLALLVPTLFLGVYWAPLANFAEQSTTLFKGW
jgi:NADH-quinone oxidoreductase subunit N